MSRHVELILKMEEGKIFSLQESFALMRVFTVMIQASAGDTSLLDNYEEPKLLELYDSGLLEIYEVNDGDRVKVGGPK